MSDSITEVRWPCAGVLECFLQHPDLRTRKPAAGAAKTMLCHGVVHNGYQEKVLAGACEACGYRESCPYRAECEIGDLKGAIGGTPYSPTADERRRERQAATVISQGGCSYIKTPAGPIVSVDQ